MELLNKIFSITPQNKTKVIQEVFHFQLKNSTVYRQWFELTGGKQQNTIDSIPFLPISFFKTHVITTTAFEPPIIFESSGTTATVNSKHYVKDWQIYETSFLTAFQLFYGAPQDWCIIGLLPAYLERKHSSLVAMVHTLVQQSRHPDSGFYLYEYEQLHATLQRLEAAGQPVILIGVTFALLDFAEQFPLPLQNTIIMETGGMKGRRKEITREALHQQLKKAFGISHVHAEYGMTELLSQAYSSGNGRFYCPSWMQVLVRNEDDPLDVQLEGEGILNIIDLANLYSCSFIATDDVGKVYSDGSFEVWGRLDNSDIRGCSLLVT